jgi:Innexin
MDFINTLKKVTKITNFSSSIDYITLRFIPALTLVCGLVFTYKQNAKSSISCYSSIPSSGIGLGDFIENSCYYAERFYNLLSTGSLEPLPFQNIYPFLPIILLVQTATLCLPKIFWVFFGNRTELSYLLKLCLNYDINGGHKSNEKLLVYFYKYLMKNGNSKWNCHFLIGYFTTKLFSLFICGTNLLFLYNEIFSKNLFYPVAILKQLIISNSSINNPSISIFQQVVMCKVQLFHTGSENNFAVQCILLYNCYYEKVFAFITFLIVLSMVLTMMDVIKWVIFYVFKPFVLLYYLDFNSVLHKNNNIIKSKDDLFTTFVKSMSLDLYFSILMIGCNVNHIIAMEVLNELYGNFKLIYQRENRQFETLV